MAARRHSSIPHAPMIVRIPLLIGWLLDRLFGDPTCLPHPVVAFGKVIAFGERKLNRGRHRQWKGGAMAIVLVGLTFALTYWLLRGLALVSPWLALSVRCLLVFFCLAGTTLIREVKLVFEALDRSLEEGRRQVARIVGRDTDSLSEQEVRQAALETLAENLSDGVIAPIFWLALLGVPGMMSYKMVNTLDSMIGYRNERYRLFGCVAARLDDVANYLPARLTALLMLISAWRLRSLFPFVRKYGRQHASPNSGYPESALAGVLDCRFGGPHNYFGELVWKPYIGDNPRPLTADDLRIAVRLNRRSELLMLLLVLLIPYL